MATLADVLSERTRQAELCERLHERWVRCVACGHACRIPEGGVGVCKVRFNRGGTLYAPWGYVAGAQCDPIEKKPFFHAWPGSLAFSFGMLGCDMHCSYCQNWITSQALRDPSAVAPPRDATPAELVRQAVHLGARSVVSTYNEPLITSEWAVAIFREARRAGLSTAFVSNGNGTPEVIAYLHPWLDAMKIDLKTFDDRQYRRLGARLQPILESIREVHARGIWLEVVTLVVPGFNDSDAELGAMAGFLASVSPDIPWHVTAFHADYKMTDPPDTTPATLSRAAAAGRRAGLRYVYAGNLPGLVGELEHTTCPTCGRVLIERRGYRIIRDDLAGRGQCLACGTTIAGMWNRCAA